MRMKQPHEHRRKGRHYTENPRENIFYLVGKSRKLPLISPVKDYSDPAIRSLQGGGIVEERAGRYGAGTEIPRRLQPNFRYDSDGFHGSRRTANGSFNSLPSAAPWNYRIIGEVILDSRLRRERARRTAGRSIDLFV